MGEIARFLFHRRQYAPSKQIVKPRAFLPNNGQTSVFEISGLPEPDIRTIGIQVGSARSTEPRGRGDLTHQDVEDAGLLFERDDKPPRHGNLVGWPSADGRRKDRNKDRRPAPCSESGTGAAPLTGEPVGSSPYPTVFRIQSAITSITSTDQVSSMAWYSLGAPVSECWKRWFRSGKEWIS